MKQTNLRGSSKAEDVSENYDDDDDVDTDGSNSKAEDAIVFESRIVQTRVRLKLPSKGEEEEVENGIIERIGRIRVDIKRI